jgi:leucyl aminopeptidase
MFTAMINMLETTGKIPKNQSLVYLVHEKDLGLLRLETGPLKYVRKQLQEEVKQVFLNHYDYGLYVQFTDDGKTGPALLEYFRGAGHQLHKQLQKQKTGQITVVDKTGSTENLMAFVEGLALSQYQFLKYFRDGEKKEYKLKKIRVYDPERKLQAPLSELQHLVDGVFFARDLINEPVVYMTAVRLAETIKKKCEGVGIRVEIFHKQKIESLKMGGLLAVNKGSMDPPTFSVLEWKPRNARNEKPLVLVGKGVVYDTGGFSLKPTKDSMDYMKSDMSGAAAVGGLMYAIGAAEVPLHVIGLIPATDNRLNGNAYVPGDIVAMGNGMSVEVMNTDAEGRMILAEALHYAGSYKPGLVIDLATLTGAAAFAIGKYGMVGMGNAGRPVFECLIQSGEKVCERIVEFPFWEDYNELLKSTVADIKNIGGREGGAITAGKFLEHFTDYPFIHLDIAGPAFVQKEYGYRGTGGTGYGIRTLFEFMKQCEL